MMHLIRSVVLGITVGVLIFSGQAGAIEMDELMDNILEDVRQETRQTIKQQARQETQEVIQEEEVIPTNSLSGPYSGDVVFAANDINHVSCSLSVDSNSFPSAFTGSCVDQNPNDVHTFTLSGTIQNSTSFSFTITETTANCNGHRTASGSGTITGNGEVGTVLKGSYGGTCGDSTGSFTLTKN